MDQDEKLKQAARAEFLRRGYKAASMAAIAEQAGMAVGSVYKLYPSKQALFLEVYFAENRAVKQRVLARVDWRDPRTVLGDFLRYNLAEIRENRILQEWSGEAIGPVVRQACIDRGEARQFNDFLGEKLADWRAQELINDDVTDECIFKLIDTLNEIDARIDADDETKTFIVQAVVEKVARG